MGEVFCDEYLWMNPKFKNLLLQGGHAAKQMAASKALAGLGSHLKLSLYRLRLQALSRPNEGNCVLRLTFTCSFYIMEYFGISSTASLENADDPNRSSGWLRASFLGPNY